MSDFDRLLQLIDSAEDVVIAYDWSQLLEPTPLRRDKQIRDVQHERHHYDDSRLEELVFAHAFAGDKRPQSDANASFYPIESPRCSAFSSSTPHVGRNVECTKACPTDARDALDATASIGSGNSDQIRETEDVTSPGENHVELQSQPSSLLSDVKDGTFALPDGRFRSYQVGQWQERFEELLLFGKEYGHLLVPHSYPPNQKLAQWVKRQRHQYKRKSMGLHSTLSSEREQLLLDVGFVFDSHKAVWYLRFQTLKAFHNVHGHCNIPTTFRDSSLTVWMKHQRRQYLLYQKGLKSTMNEERIRLLDSIGLDWNPRNLIKTFPTKLH